jgi:hypothetical protein
MTTERFHRPENDRSPDDSSPLRPRSGHLDELRKKAERVSQAAQDAIAKVLAAGDAEQQLSSLRNSSGQ